MGDRSPRETLSQKNGGVGRNAVSLIAKKLADIRPKQHDLEAGQTLILSAPQSGFSRLALRIMTCIFLETGGRPGLDFQRR